MEEKIKEIIRNIVREMMTYEELGEITTTANISIPSIPFAFKKTDGTDADDENDDEFVDRVIKSTGYKKVNENRWHDLKKSEGTPRQKVGRGVSKVNKQLSEIETFLRWYGKIKKEGDLNSDQYWKRTQKNLLRIRERLTKIQNRISELS